MPEIYWIDADCPDATNWIGGPPLDILRAVVRFHPLAWVIA